MSIPPYLLAIADQGAARAREGALDLDLDALAEFNRGTDRAVRANRDRERRERFLDAFYIYNEKPQR